jgi:ABC-2 type transport system permease protein
MKALLIFSLKRRIFNPISIALQIMFILILLIAINFDFVSAWFNLDFDRPYQIVANNQFKERIRDFDIWKQHGFEFHHSQGDIKIDFNDGRYFVQAAQDPLLQRKLYELILINHKQNILINSEDSVYTWLEHYEHVEVDFDQVQESSKAIKHHLIFVFLTSIYFMMLNFIAVNSNEIILEKISNVIPMFLSSITPLQHYFIKLMLGFVSVVFQFVSSFGVLGILIYLRYQQDQFKGLLKLVSKYLSLPSELMNLQDILEWLEFSFRDFRFMLISLMFMFVGIFTIQVLILVLSSKVKTMEEASSIQGPFYLMLLLMYYIALGLNQSTQGNSMITTVLSYMPIFSMMVMPIRLMSHTLFMYEISLSFMFSTLFYITTLVILYPLYRKGILDEA